ncbi:RNA polymerase 3 subunit RPC82 family protein [Heracleum sosnowskyi]|uniref:RNA polymerase 3 subunit RPC82 family protein n=1 Tax=Heracleum sosnowskyi TaxID=360622 RepID=A0AAD8M8Y7_9APIA|nr:RNA polymerase 3 subunit RPC82 family protein [Heracleum sosnowskyi]
MASFKYVLKSLALFALAFAFCIQGTLGSIACEDLNKESCAYAISSSGKRCVLEQRVRRSGEEAFTCRTSEIEADKLKDWIESDECIRACGLERNVLGISSDSLLEPHFARKLCSTRCYNNCPNIMDLYFNLAAGEGLFLPKFCASRGRRTRRGMSEMIRSSGNVAAGPVSAGKFVVAEGPEAAEFMDEEAEGPGADNMYMEEAEAPAF